MPATEEPTLSLAEWLVLCLVCEKPQHGFAIARLLGSDGDLGQDLAGTQAGRLPGAAAA